MERRYFEDSLGPVPYNGLAVSHYICIYLLSLWPDVQPHPPVGDFFDLLDIAALFKLISGLEVNGEVDFYSFGFSLL